jgi:hypothetical protein
MGRLAIFATIEVQPGTRDEAVQILMRHRENRSYRFVGIPSGS